MHSCSDVVHFTRVHVHVIALVVDVVCLMLVSVLVSMFMLYLYSFRSQFSVVGGILFAEKTTAERSYTGFNLIPASGVGEAVGGISEAAAGDEKNGGKGVERTFKNDMICCEMTFRYTQTSRRAP